MRWVVQGIGGERTMVNDRTHETCTSRGARWCKGDEIVRGRLSGDDVVMVIECARAINSGRLLHE